MRLFFVLMLACALSCATYAQAPEIKASGAVLIDGESGRVLYALHENMPYPMASTTKIMTALVALDEMALDDTVVAGKNAAHVPGTSLYLTEGEQLSGEQMLEGLLLRSGNDAAVAIAEHVAGSVQEFCRMMNDRAEALGANAHFTNPHGLDADGHAASALGMAKIAREALAYPDFRRIVLMPSATIPWRNNPYDRVLTNKNRLLREYEGATGVKIGFTDNAGRCLVFSAKRGDTELIGCVLHCGAWFESAKTLLDYGFTSYTRRALYAAGEIVATVRVENGLTSALDVVAARDCAVPLKDGETCAVTLGFENLTAPIKPGETVGWARIAVDGETVYSVRLLANGAIPARTFRNCLRYVFDRLNPAY